MKVKVTEDRTKEFNKLIESFKNDKVVVGIPESTAGREGPINNATILFINNFGSPGQNIPARPVMDIGIKNAQDRITDEFKKCAENPTDDRWNTCLERVGTIASNSIKKVITDQEGIKPPEPETLAARKNKGHGSEKSLLVTGQLRNAITYVVRK